MPRIGSLPILSSAVTKADLEAKLGAQTPHAFAIGNGPSNPLNWTVPPNNGQIPIGSTGSDPVINTLTAGVGIAITNGPGNITIEAVGGTPGTFTEDTGSATAFANNVNIFGTAAQGIVTSGAGSTISLTALNASTTQKGVASFDAMQFTVTAGAVSLSTPISVANGGTGATTLTGVLTGNGTSPVTASPVTQHGILLGGAANAVTSLGVAGDGFLPIGSSGVNPVLAQLTPGTGISITNAAGSITIATNSASLVNTLTGNSGGAISPTLGNINTLGTGSITIAGSGNTLTTQLTGLTDHNVLVGAGTATITNVSPSATSGVPLVSRGAAADPVFGTAVVAGGGTGDTSFIVYAPVCGGTITTGALQSASTGISNVGYVLTSMGSSSLPTWQAPSGGSGITTIDGDSGSITGSTVTISGGSTGLLTSGSFATMNLTGTLNVGSGGTGAVSLTGILTGNGTSAVTASPVTQHSLLLGDVANGVTSLGVATHGQLPIGSTGNNPVLNTLTAGAGISITNGAGTITIATNSASLVSTLTGNSGGAISPTLGNINTLGTGSITIAGSGNTLTTQLTGLTAHNVLVGAGSATITNVPPSATSGIPLISQGAAADPAFGTAVVAGGGTGATTLTGILTGNGTSPVTASPVTQFSLLLGGAANAVASLGVATDGQLPIGSTGANPVLNTLTAGTGISITNAAGSITIATNGASTVNTLTGNTGGAISPTAGNINTLGTGSITIAGSGSTLTTQLTGLTAHNVLVGAGSATITNVPPSATSGIPLISQGAAADPAFGTAVVAGGGTGATTLTGVLTGNGTSPVTASPVTQFSLLLGGAANAVVSLGVATNGQLPIGSTGNNPVLAQLSAGTGISIANAPGSITIAATGGGIAWVDQTTTPVTLAANTGYIADNPTASGRLIFTLPGTPSLGDTYIITGRSNGGANTAGWQVSTNAMTQTIFFGNTSTTGNVQSTFQTDSIRIVCTQAAGSSSEFTVVDSQGGAIAIN